METTIGQLLSQPLPAAQDRNKSREIAAQRSAPLDAIEWLFKQFVLHYGAARMAAFWGSPKEADDAKRYWGKRLAGIDQVAVAYGLAHLPNNPPTVDEFRAVCARAPRPTVLALDVKRSPESDEEGRKRIEGLRRRFTFREPELWLTSAASTAPSSHSIEPAKNGNARASAAASCASRR